MYGTRVVAIMVETPWAIELSVYFRLYCPSFHKEMSIKAVRQAPTSPKTIPRNTVSSVPAASCSSGAVSAWLYSVPIVIRVTPPIAMPVLRIYMYVAFSPMRM